MEATANPDVKDKTDLEFARSYKPNHDAKQYEWVIEYAENKVSLMVKSLEALDSKTETLMRYFGGVAAGLAAFTSLAFKDHLDLTWVLIPSIVALLWGALRAGRSSAPHDFYAPPSIQQAFRFADAYGPIGTVKFHAFWVPLEGKLKVMTEEKSLAYYVALRCLWTAVAWAVTVTILALNIRLENLTRLSVEHIRNFF